MQGNQIRETFLKYFADKDHKIIKSSSLVPHNDPTLLFTNAGMVQFKDVFTGVEKKDYSRAVTSQKCVRAGGKHNDLDTVGRTARHHTFFEMLGNFSFGDYFKKEAIEYAWEFLTEVLKLPKEKLWVTIYLDDDEANKLWIENTDVSPERIIRLGEKDNFWSMGDTGPCGPCSEIIYDRGVSFACEASDCAIGVCDCDRWLEIWNLVFMQYERNEKGEISPLPRPSIDTGMGLERITSIIQGVNSNYETDLLSPLIQWVESITGIKYSDTEKGFPFRVIADHVRSCTFLIADGVLPGNEGRNYVLRRILRRAVRFGKFLGINEPFLYKMVPEVVSLMGEAYPELAENQDNILKTIKIEEQRFHETINDGIKMASEIIENTKKAGKSYISGKDAFLLYDTFGFPLDLTKDLAEENAIEVDDEGFEEEMELQRKRARAARDEAIGFDFSTSLLNIFSEVDETRSVCFEQYKHKTQILSIIIDEKEVAAAKAGQDVFLALKESPFYPEGGGQIGDQGEVFGTEGKVEIIDVKKLPNEKIIHIGKVISGEIKTGEEVSACVNSGRRIDTAKNHTATHLLHQSLKRVLGEHINQAGSLVTPQRLRFDFTHFQAISEENLLEIENLVNKQILMAVNVSAYETSLEQAKKEGAEALFGEKYSDKVRVIKIDDYSLELCGGTHVDKTSDIGIFKIISEGGIGSGLRRIEAITGLEALKYLNNIEKMAKRTAGILRTNIDNIPAKVNVLLRDNKEKSRELERLVSKLASYQSEDLLDQVVTVNNIKLLATKVDAKDMDALRNIGDTLRNKLQSGVIVIGSNIGDRPNFLVMATKDVIQKGVHAGNLIREVAKIADGGGGGRPDMAQAGGKDAAKLEEALQMAAKILSEQIE